MGRVEWPDDRLELIVVRFYDDVGRIEAEPFPAACLEPVRAFRADQHEHAVAPSHSLELEHDSGIGLDAGARHGHVRPTVQDREGLREPSPYVGARTSGDKDASQP